MPEYRKDNTGCRRAFIVRSDGGEDTKRLCEGDADEGSEWTDVEFCDFCRDREVEL